MNEPKFQWSIFPEGRRDEQFVVRADTIDELKLQKAQVMDLLKNPVEPIKQEVPLASVPKQPAYKGDVPPCPKCGRDMWDNRPKKATGEFNPAAPDFKCKDKACGGVVWPPKGVKIPADGSSYAQTGGER